MRDAHLRRPTKQHSRKTNARAHSRTHYAAGVLFSNIDYIDVLLYVFNTNVHNLLFRIRLYSVLCKAREQKHF